MQRECPPTRMIRRSFSGEAEVLKAVADPHRLRILATLVRAKDEVCVCDFTGGLPLNQPTVSHHLRILKDAGLVTCERRGTWGYYRIEADARMKLRNVLNRVLRERTRT